jgi:allantoinase
MKKESLIKGGSVVTPSKIFNADILVRDGIIEAIGLDLSAMASQEAEVIDATDLHIMPGVVDPHSHLWEAGFVSGADFEDSTASAVAGGITTIIDMPLTTPEILDIKSFEEKVDIGLRSSHVDFALHGGVRPSNLCELRSMWYAGATAFKIFTCDTGCAMHGVIDDSDLLATLNTIASFGGLATFHAENNQLLIANRADLEKKGRKDNAAFNEWRNETVELEAINRILFYAERTGARVNIVHVTSPNGVEMISQASKRGIKATAETCPHYLYFTDKDIEERGSWVTCSPPMRGADARDGMRNLINSGAIRTIGSDHGPVDPMLKQRGHNNIFNSQPGMPMNETMVPLMLNLAKNGEFTIGRLAEVSSEWPAKLYGLYPKKGAIQIGSDGDFTIVDLGRKWSVQAKNLIGKSGWTPFESMELTGNVVMTIIRGRVAARDGRPVNELGQAIFVTRQ